MSSRWRYLLPIGLLGLMLLPVVLLLGLQANQQMLKHYQEERLTRADRQTLVVPAASVIWEEQGEELLINGKYFDVEHLKQQGNLLYLTGYFDEAETAVWQALQQAVGQQSGAVFSRLFLLLQCLLPLALLRFVLLYVAGPIFWKRYQSPFLCFSLRLPPFNPPRSSPYLFDFAFIVPRGSKV